MVDDRYLGGKGDIAVTGNSSANLERWSAWVAAADDHDCHMIAQL
jgi:hypothetical protein